MIEQRKQIHVNLVGDQVDDYDLVVHESGITNDNDLVRHLFRQRANEIRAEKEWRRCLAVTHAARKGLITEESANAMLGLVPEGTVEA